MHPRRRAGATDVRHSIEFADLLDPIGAISPPRATAASDTVDIDMAFADMLVADMRAADTLEPPPEVEPEPVVEVAEVEEVAEVVEPIAVSRFADIDVDDDRLPVHAPAKRFRLR